MHGLSTLAVTLTRNLSPALGSDLNISAALRKKVLKWLWVNSTAKQLKQPGSHSDAIDCHTLAKGAVISFKKLNFGGF